MARLKDPLRRSLILDTALELFSQRGFAAVSVKDIASSANISLGSLYTYFDSKEQVVNHLFRHWKLILSTFVGEGLESLRGRAAHRQMWHNLGRFVLTYPKAFSFLESQMHSPYLDEESRHVEMAMTRAAAQFYIDQLQLALSPETAQLTMSATFGMYVQVFKAASVDLLAFDEPMLAQLEAMAWRMSSGA